MIHEYRRVHSGVAAEVEIAKFHSAASNSS